MWIVLAEPMCYYRLPRTAELIKLSPGECRLNFVFLFQGSVRLDAERFRHSSLRRKVLSASTLLSPFEARRSEYFSMKNSKAEGLPEGLISVVRIPIPFHFSGHRECSTRARECLHETSRNIRQRERAEISMGSHKLFRSKSEPRNPEIIYYSLKNARYTYIQIDSFEHEFLSDKSSSM